MVAFSVIIVTYNSHHTLGVCLQFLEEACKNAPHEILVWDNASPIAIPASLKDRFPKVHWHFNTKNLGFAICLQSSRPRQSIPLLVFYQSRHLCGPSNYAANAGVLPKQTYWRAGLSNYQWGWQLSTFQPPLLSQPAQRNRRAFGH